MGERGLYSEQPNAVTFLTPTLFRAAIVAAGAGADRQTTMSTSSCSPTAV